MASREQDMEAEADYFAMCLLMPRDLVIAEVRAMGGVDLVDDEEVGKLAKKFGVSIGLMTARLLQLQAAAAKE